MGNYKVPTPPLDSLSPKERADRAQAPDETTDKTSGRVSFDSRGNSVWEWKDEETGKFSRDVSTQRLKKLEATELTLEDTRRLKKVQNTSQQDNPAQGGGFNPYDRGTIDPKKSGSSRPEFHRGSAPTMPPAPIAKSAGEPRKPIKDLKRLQEWMEMKKRLEKQKNND